MDGTRTVEMLRRDLETHVSAPGSPVEIGAADVERKVTEIARLALLIA